MPTRHSRASLADSTQARQSPLSFAPSPISGRRGADSSSKGNALVAGTATSCTPSTCRVPLSGSSSSRCTRTTPTTENQPTHGTAETTGTTTGTGRHPSRDPGPASATGTEIATETAATTGEAATMTAGGTGTAGEAATGTTETDRTATRTARNHRRSDAPWSNSGIARERAVLVVVVVRQRMTTAPGPGRPARSDAQWSPSGIASGTRSPSSMRTASTAHAEEMTPALHALGGRAGQGRGGFQLNSLECSLTCVHACGVRQ
mmetsp:Transcript_40141/g.100466  ORF Transcript_40141/g.100466 Transcript_40141/m.100466 type:complete len:262 (+) Transcript_40141:396-1181(+)